MKLLLRVWGKHWHILITLSAHVFCGSARVGKCGFQLQKAYALEFSCSSPHPAPVYLQLGAHGQDGCL